MLVALLWSGCVTRDVDNRAAVPWGRPTKAEMSRDWWLDPGYVDPDDRYP